PSKTRSPATNTRSTPTSSPRRSSAASAPGARSRRRSAEAMLVTAQVALRAARAEGHRGVTGGDRADARGGWVGRHLYGQARAELEVLATGRGQLPGLDPELRGHLGHPGRERQRIEVDIDRHAAALREVARIGG